LSRKSDVSAAHELSAQTEVSATRELLVQMKVLAGGLLSAQKEISAVQVLSAQSIGHTEHRGFACGSPDQALDMAKGHPRTTHLTKHPTQIMYGIHLGKPYTPSIGGCGYQLSYAAAQVPGFQLPYLQL
ncbi:Hypothetical predicted protein, partial [Marmota monax]